MRPRPRHQVKAWQAGSCRVDSCARDKPTERHMLQVKHLSSPSGAPAARCQRRSTGQRRRPERRPWRRRHSGRDPGAPALAPMTPRLSARAVEQGNGSQSAAMACDKLVLAGGRPFHPLRTSCCSVACSISLDRRDSSATSAAGGRKPPSTPIAAAGCRPFLQMNRRRDPARSIRAGALLRALDELPTCAVAAARRRHVGQQSRLHSAVLQFRHRYATWEHPHVRIPTSEPAGDSQQLKRLVCFDIGGGRPTCAERGRE